MTRTMKPRRHEKHETAKPTTRRFISCPSCFRGSIFCAALLLVSALLGIAQADSLNVRYIGSCSTADWAWDVAVSGDYAYVADFLAGLCVISVANPTHPDTVGHLDTPDRALGVAVSDGYAYLAVEDSGLLVISVADPAHPVAVGRFDTPGVAIGVAVVGGFVYVAGGDSGLRVISVADPAHPVEVGYCDTPGRARGVTVVGDYAYVADDTAGLRVISVADPVHPTEVGHNSLGWALDVAASGDHVYVAGYAGGLRVVSVIDPAHPVEVGNSGPSYAQDVTAKGDHAYVAANDFGFQVLQFYGGALGDLDVDNDSLEVVADTIRLRSSHAPGLYHDYALGEFILVNTSGSYNPDSTDGPSTSPLDSLSFTGSLSGPGGTLDSILIPNLPGSLAQGQAVVCTLAVYAPDSLSMGDYSGQIVITGLDSLHHKTLDTVYALVRRFGDIDVDNDSLDVVADTIRLLPRLASVGPPRVYTEYALGEFILVNTSESCNPDTADGPSLSLVDSLSFTGSLTGLGGTIDSILIPNLPDSLARGQTVACTLAVSMPPRLQDGDYAGSITIAGRDTAGMLVDEIFHALFKKTTLGDLDVDGDSLDVASDTMDLHTQPAGPAYSPHAKARFMLLNTYEFYNPDVEDGPSRSPLREAKVEVKVEAQNWTAPPCSVYVLNLPPSLEVGQAVECTLALVLPVGTELDNYSGVVTIDACDTLGYRVRDSFFLTMRGPQPRQSLDSLQVAPIPYKPNQNPEHDAIHFQGLSAGAKVIVYDASGQSVWSATEAGDGHLKWDAKVASGIYVYLVVAKDGQSEVGKLPVIR